MPSSVTLRRSPCSPGTRQSRRIRSPSLHRRPQGTFFVVGDNLANSFDSRIPEFGPVSADMIRGKPLFLYWSPNLRHIGCPLR
jgi:type IV secretory pathway protease TraF